MESLIEHLRDLFQKGGPVQYVILAASIYGGILVFERWLKYRSIASRMDELLTMIYDVTEIDDKAMEKMDKAFPMGRIAWVAWESRMLGREGMLEKVRVRFSTEELYILRRLGAVAVIGSLLPMVGLLGTVVGMIVAFNAIAVYGTGDPKILADGISQALLTTEAGLITSIPLLYIHQMLTDQAELITRKMDTFSTHLIQVIPSS
ncbi:MAG: MotA/TolQ/ExbB proton channel family protein [Nitrospinota bacterium]|nr:MotA/TolQ/ExbB proton channel family protein [Nitrospinota bacterium]